MLNLMTGLGSLGGHLGGWRHPKAWRGTHLNLDHHIKAAQLAERGKFDILFLADGNAVRQMDKPALFEANSPSDRPSVFEPLTLLSAISQHTNSIGLLATATTTYDEPYLLARRFASLDHLSNGRACWNIVTGSYPGDALNFSRDEHVEKATRYERAGEFVEVAKGLWNSWDDGAFIEDRESGRYLDASRVHTLHHEGPHFQVKGPLNIARPPQGFPVLFLAGQSEAGRDLAARHADCVFSVAGTIENGRAYRDDMMARLDAYDRAPETLRVIPGASVYVAESEAEADDLYEELQSLISPALGVPYLSKLVEMDLSGYDVDGPLPDLSGDVVGIVSFRKTIAEMAAKEGLTIRQTYERVLPSMGHVLFKGTAVTVADQIEEWYRTGACDGFNIGGPVMPLGLESIVELLIPELQRRGLFRTEYTGRTLRENMGLPTPRNPYFEKELIA
ncbi:LLM class flavin-dependent oxidoreductase [Microbacterium sp. BWT-B31]|uniref:LLM class flavin-dependent oxidoreductase n=1 Tax=Microbacterium sp. BWT-B31 TaxID=3232072 RepID=UPI003528A5E7